MKIGVFGGTFNPVHDGHLAAARAAADHFGLDRVLFIPSAVPPHKAPPTPFEHRFAMVGLAVAADPRFAASRIEQGEQKNYSLHTLEKLAQLYPGDELYFLIGADAFAEITTWYRWRDVVSRVSFVVVSRPGHEYTVPPGARVHRLDQLAVPFSSSDLRRRLARGEQPEGIPPAVLSYIREHRLYELPPADPGDLA
ncbi:MAG: nicotinate-nucleotide adenylyltransferase [Bryobacteraceae bacterium]|nr:nicotinate-nucleotide adenylyltransferase [Bryobacteraceae bacterium]